MLKSFLGADKARKGLCRPVQIAVTYVAALSGDVASHPGFLGTQNFPTAF